MVEIINLSIGLDDYIDKYNLRIVGSLLNTLPESLCDFVDGGGLLLGICNGFQTLAKLGLLPHLPDAPFARRIALTDNDRGVFHDGWVTLRMNPSCPISQSGPAMPKICSQG